MLRTSLKLVLFAGVLALAGCGGGGDDEPPPVEPPPPTIQSQFGTTFAGAFNAAVTAEPTDVLPGDLPALSLTTDPKDF